MPWDATVLWVADIDPLGDPGGAQCRLVRPCPVASGRGESLVQPEWGPDGELYVISDRSDWWNVYRVTPGALLPVFPVEAEVGGPAWIFGQSRYLVGATGIWLSYSSAEGAHLVAVSADGSAQDDVLPFVSLDSLRLDHDEHGERIVAIG